MIKARKCVEPLKPYVPGKPIADVKKEYKIDEVYKLASNENPLGCSKKVTEILQKSLEELSIYPDGNCKKLREAIAKHYKIEENQLVFGTGTDEIISMISKAFVNSGDECITATTTFGQYESSVLQMDGKIIKTPMKNYGFDLDEIANQVTDKTKIIFIANPNNPTGTIFTEDEQITFVKKIPSDVLIIFDEAYSEFVFEPNFPKTLELMKKYNNVMLFKTFSKAYGLASLRVGYGIGDCEIISQLEKIRNPFNVSSWAQIAATTAILDQEFVKESAKTNKETLSFVETELDKMGLKYIKSYTNFIMIDIKKDSVWAFEELMKKGVIIRAGKAFNMNTFLRVTIGTKKEMEIFLLALAEILA